MASFFPSISVSPSQLSELSAIMRALAHERKGAASALRLMAEQYEISATGGAMVEAMRQEHRG